MNRLIGPLTRAHGRRAAVGAVSALLLVLMFMPGALGTTSSCNNTATLEKSAFEIDGGANGANLVVDTSGCIDWLTDGTNSGFRPGVSAKNDLPTGSNDDSFGQGTAEDNPNPTVVTGSIPPNKSDLKAFGVFSETGETSTPNPSGKFLELFWSRVQNPSGTTNMDFELNKEFCDGTATHCANNGSAKNPVYVTPKRTTGDKLITYDLSKGGTVPAISIRTWNGTAWGTASVISGGGPTATALGSVNLVTILATQTGGATGGLTASLGQQDPFTFGEASIAYSAIFSGIECGNFGSAYLKSRSSDSFSAEIKDFVAPEKVNITNCASLTTTATASVTIGSPISDTAHLTAVTSNAGGTITFHLFSNATCTTEVTTGLSPVSVSGPNDYNSGNFTPTAVGTYYWTAHYSGDANNSSADTACGDANESSVVNKKQPSLSTTATASVTIGDPISDTAHLSNATNDASGTITFKLYSDASCSTLVTTLTNNSVSGNGDYNSGDYTPGAVGTYYWTASYGGDAKNESVSTSCGDSNESSIVGKAPSTIITAQQIFPQDSATLSASAGGTPTGSVTFKLFGPNNSTCDSNGAAAKYSETVTLVGGSAATTNGTFHIDAATADTYKWLVTYGGDGTHDGTTSACGTEHFDLTIANS
jgi:hypothetical protein